MRKMMRGGIRIAKGLMSDFGWKKYKTNSLASGPNTLMKKFKNTLNKPETVKAEAAKVEPVKAAPAKITAAKPEMPKVGRVSFELVKPEAKNVYVAGDFNDWKPERAPLIPVGNGRWVGDLTLKPGRHEYLFVVDGQWVLDPNAKESVQNPFGGRNSILGVS